MAGITATRRETVQPRPDQPQPAAATWPLRAGLDLGAVPTAPGCGRAWTRAILWEWRLARLADQAELITSELVTNALLASRWLDRPAIGLTLLSDRVRLVILVRDFNPGIPVPRHASDEEESGRGLMLVEAISDRFGWERPADGTPGKVVWAVLQLVHKPIGGAPRAMPGLVRPGNAARPADGLEAHRAAADMGTLRQVRAALDRL
jgi:anti-sigma regulatory factor (Ser/Thr protein kinase)